MGLRNSKNKRNSYDVAAVVSNKDFTYKNHERPLPKVELPLKKEKIVNNESEETIMASTTVAEQTNANAVIEVVREVPDPRVPDWVNEHNFKNMLLKTYPNIKEVTAFKAFPALAAGENFSTLMLRVQLTVKFEDNSMKDFSFMLKVPHTTEEMQQFLQAINLFTIENAVYLEVIPELEQMYRQAGVEVKLAAKSYRLELEDSNIHYVLLEDLSVEAFKNANRLECLNMEHTLSVLRKMAQFHAATACRVARKGSYPSIFTPDMDSDIARAFLSQMFMSFKKPVLENLKTYENGEKYYDLMESFFDNLVELFVCANKLLPNYFCALSHGDAWSNNILFKYSDDGHLEDTVLIDFQNSRWNSPAADLYYFIFSSVQIDIKLAQFDYFVCYYHEHLRENLTLLKYPLEIPSLKEFHIQLLDFGVMATMTSFLTLGIVLLDPTDNAKFENFIKDSEESIQFRNSMYTNERYRKYINEILPWLYNRGFMEINLRCSDIDNRIAIADKLKAVETPQITQQTEIINDSTCCYLEWLSETLFLNVIRADCENFENIVQFAVSPATKSGNTHSSTLWQIDIDIELTDHTNHSLSYVLKIPRHGEQTKAIISMGKVFEKESLVYFDIIPRLENMYKEKAGIDVAFAPKSFKLNQVETTDGLVLENVRIKNFKTCDRLEGLDMKHMEAALKKLAQFHAASACLLETTEGIPDICKKSTLPDDIRRQSENMAAIFIKSFNNCEGSGKYFNEVKNYADNLLSFLTKATLIDKNKLNVLNHGHCWTNSILFQHDSEGNISNTYFVDFQLVQYGTPCYDLFHFLLSSPKLELKLEYFDYFIRYYYDNLKSALELLRYDKPIPSLKDLHQDLLDNAVWAFYTILCILPIALLDPNDTPILEQNAREKEDAIAFREKMFLSRYYRSHMESILPWLYRRGLLDL